jgi:serine/threonine-protein kinase
MSAAAAREMLKAGGLGYREIGRRESPEIGAGSVLTQDPRPDAQVAPSAIVKVILSDGAKTVTVPNVTQMSIAQATRNLEAAGLVAGGVQEAYDEHVPAGYVATTYPSHGSRVVRGTVVDMVTSLGPRPMLPPGPPLPPQPEAGSEHEQKLDFTVPADVGPGEVKVTVEISDGRNRRVIYEGRHKPGDSIPTQTLVVTEPITSRVLINDQIRIEHRHEP